MPDTSHRVPRLAGLAGIGYVVLFFAANFPTGVGDHIYGQHAPATVVTWATAHAALLHAAVLLDLADDWLFALFAFLVIAVAGGRGLAAVLGCVGVAAAEAVYAVIRGLQYAIPQLASLAGGDAAAQAAVVLQSTLVFSVQSLPLAIGVAAIGYLLLHSTRVHRIFGALALAVALLFGVAFPLREIAPGLGAFETLAAVGLLLWTAAISLALLLRGAPDASSSELRPGASLLGSESGGVSR